jgi:hypothetical protein
MRPKFRSQESQRGEGIPSVARAPSARFAETIKHALTREHDGAPSTIIGAVVDRLTE